MPSKEEVIESLNKGSYGVAEVKQLINSVKSKEPSHTSPKIVRKGDVFIYTLGQKKRPVVVYKVRDGLAYGLSLSTTQDNMNLCECKASRFFFKDVQQNFFSKGVVVVKVQHVIDNFCFVYEHKREIDIAIKQLRKLI